MCPVMAAPSAGRTGAVGSWEKGPVTAAYSTACRATTTTCNVALGVGVGGASASGGMEMENGPVMAADCAAQRTVAVASMACTACRTEYGGTVMAGFSVTDLVAATDCVGCRTAAGTAIAMGVGRVDVEEGRANGLVVAVVSTAYLVMVMAWVACGTTAKSFQFGNGRAVDSQSEKGNNALYNT